MGSIFFNNEHLFNQLKIKLVMNLEILKNISIILCQNFSDFEEVRFFLELTYIT